MLLKYQLITNNDTLKILCESLMNKQVIALDTEFIRLRTYYPKIGLIQLFDGDNLALIDPLTIDNWQYFTAILQNRSQTKYFHACGEDIDVFMHQFNLLPSPILDSQILAAFLNNDLCTSYVILVKKYLNITLSKTETRTDWLSRPLSKAQCCYAAADVYYLLQLTEKLIEIVKKEGWLKAVKEECQVFVSKKSALVSPKNAYLKIKRAAQLKGIQLSYLQLLAAWRLQYAREHNIAVNLVLPETLIWKIACYKPTSLTELKKIGAHEREIRLYGNIIMELLCQPINADLMPVRLVTDYKNYITITEHLRQAAVKIAKETGLNKSILLSRRHINHYVKWLDNKNQSEPEIISGWRAPLFEPYLATV